MFCGEIDINSKCRKNIETKKFFEDAVFLLTLYDLVFEGMDNPTSVLFVVLISIGGSICEAFSKKIMRELCSSHRKQYGSSLHEQHTGLSVTFVRDDNRHDKKLQEYGGNHHILEPFYIKNGFKIYPSKDRKLVH